MNINKQLLVLVTAGMVLAMHTDVGAKLAVAGAGAASCGKFIAVNDESSRRLFFMWAQGFLTGLNMQHIFEQSNLGSTDLQDHNGQKLWLENFCRENPLESYWIAVTTLWQTLREKQGLDPDLVAK